MRTNHLTEDQRERYRARLLSPAELLAASEHLRACDDCRGKLRASGAMASPAETLAQLGSPHLTYEDLEARVEGRDDRMRQSLTEAHLALCGACRAEYQDLSGFRDSLQPVARPAASSPQRTWTFWRRPQLALATLALLAVVALSWWALRRDPVRNTRIEEVPAVAPAPPPSPSPTPRSAALELLAHVDPPPYRQAVLRGAPNQAEIRFRGAMQFYVKGDYADALPALESASALDPAAAGPRFFAATCQLLQGMPDPAVAGFRGVIARGESPYLEKAQFYLAKALLRKGDAVGATRALEATVRLKGDFETPARELLRQLRAAVQSKP